MKNLIIDTDVGYDDLMAIIMLVNNQRYTIKAISTVFGLTIPPTSANNLSSVLNYLGGSTPPIFVGANQAINPTSINFPVYDIDRATKLTLLQSLKLPQAQTQRFQGLTKLTTLIQNLTQPTSMLCLGPLTNIAQLLQQQPRLFQTKIDRLIIMGGAVFTKGNTSPNFKSEYNLALDPKAAQIVFGSDMPITLVAMDSVRNAPANPIVQRLSSSQQSRFNNFFKAVKITTPRSNSGKLLRQIILSNNNDYDYFYDVVAAAAFIEPQIVLSTKRLSLTVDTQTNLGQTIATSTGNNNVDLITNIDQQQFYQQILKLII